MTALRRAACAAACLFGGLSQAQGTFKNAPPVDAAAQASPIGAAHAGAAVDSSSQASPLLGADPHPSAALPGGVTLVVRLDDKADSASLRNGQTLRATLVRSEGAGSLKAEMPVQLTVVGATPAGRIYAAGELSLAVSQVGSQTVFSDILTFRGTPGHQDLPDSAPALGTNAGLAAGTTLTFHSQGAPEPAGTGDRSGAGIAPGSVNGTANGSLAAQPAGGPKP